MAERTAFAGVRRAYAKAIGCMVLQRWIPHSFRLALVCGCLPPASDS